MRALVLSFLVLLVLIPQDLQSQEARFKVRVLLASKQGERIDPQIPDGISKYLKKTFGVRYSAFQLLDSRVLKVKLEQTGEVTLPDQSVLKLRFRGVPGDFIKLTMEVEDLRTTIRIKNGGLFFQAGHKYGNGILILAIGAQTVDDEPESEEETFTTPRPDPRPGWTEDSAMPKKLIEDKGSFTK